MSIKVDTMLVELAKFRQDLVVAQDSAKRAQEVLETEPLWKKVQSFKDAVSVIQTAITAQENSIREASLAEYAENQIKDFGGVQIKNFTVLEYDENIAVNYCLEHSHAKLLKLDKRGFEKVAKELQPDFVTIKEEARAQIATDLSDYLQ